MIILRALARLEPRRLGTFLWLRVRLPVLADRTGPSWDCDYRCCRQHSGFWKVLGYQRSEPSRGALRKKGGWDVATRLAALPHELSVSKAIGI